MNQKQFMDAMIALSHRNLDTAQKKNNDYAGDDDAFRNFRACERHGISMGQGILVRMEDKMARLGNLLQKEPSVAGETLLDTALDLANYALILAVWWEDERAKQADVVVGKPHSSDRGLFGGTGGAASIIPFDGNKRDT